MIPIADNIISELYNTYHRNISDFNHNVAGVLHIYSPPQYVLTGVRGADLVKNITVLAVTTVCAILVISCSGPLDERLSDNTNESPTPQPISASTCTIGDGRATSLVIKNNEDFTWGGVNIYLSKSGVDYAGAFDEFQPESVNPSIPLTNSYDFYMDYTPGSQGSGAASADPSSFRCHTCPERKPLGNFANLETALITVSTPRPGQWSGSVPKCEE